MNKGTKTKAGAAGPGITDIPHEEVKHSENGVSLMAKVITPEDQIEIEVKKFDIAEAGIAILKEKYGGLVINGPDDKAGYKAVREAWRDVQSKRTGTEKKGLELRNGYGIITKGIKKKQDILVELMLPLEEELYTKWKAIDEAKEKIEREKKEAEEAALNERLSMLTNLGMQFKDGFWQLGETISIDVATLRAMPEKQYEALKNAVYAKASEIESERIRAEKEREREAERLQKEKDELARQQKELQEQQAEMNRQREELENQKREAAKQKTENRINRLVGLGMRNNPTSGNLYFDNGFLSFISSVDDFKNMTDSEFETYYKDHEEGITDRNKRKADHEELVNQEKAEKSRREKNIAGHMASIGMTYNYQHSRYEFINEVLTLTADWNILLPMDDDAVKQFAIDAGASILAAKSQVEKLEKQRKDAAEKEAKLGMKEKDLFAVLLGDVVICRDRIDSEMFKTKIWQNRANKLQTALSNLIKEFE